MKQNNFSNITLVTQRAKVHSIEIGALVYLSLFNNLIKENVLMHYLSEGIASTTTCVKEVIL